MLTYTVQTQDFEGPLDLLLHLVRQEKMDIWDIDISLLADRFLDYLHRMEEANLEIGGEFMLTCAELMRIKSRMLLPAEPIDEDEQGIDPREELSRRLDEYARFKEISQDLKDRMTERVYVFGRPLDGDDGLVIPPPALADVSPMDLFLSLQKILEGKPEVLEPVREIEPQRLSVREFMVIIMKRLREAGTSSFEVLIDEAHTRIEVVVAFLAVLELLRRQRVRARQRGAYGEIVISLVEKHV